MAGKSGRGQLSMPHNCVVLEFICITLMKVDVVNTRTHLVRDKYPLTGELSQLSQHCKTPVQLEAGVGMRPWVGGDVPYVASDCVVFRAKLPHCTHWD